MWVRASQHHERDEVVDVPEPVAHADRQLDLVAHRLRPRVAQAQPHRPDDGVAVPARFLRQLLDLPGPASRRAAQPGVEQRGRRGRARRLEHVAQALLEQAGPVEPLVLAGDPPEVERLPLREALRVLEQG